MKALLLLACLFTSMVAAETAAPAVERTAPLVVNLTSADPHRALMALTFALKQAKRGHPTTVYLNDQGVRIADKGGDAALADQRKAVGDLVALGAVILACPMCSKHCGISAEAYLPGITVSSPERIEAALFAPGARSLSW
jgi:predicted peroxiredoxin